MDTQPDIHTTIQPSKRHIQELIRPHVPDLVLKALYLAEHGDNDNVKLGAIKLLLAKVVPDLKATELSGDDGKPLLIFDLKEYLGHTTTAGTATETE